MDREWWVGRVWPGFVGAAIFFVLLLLWNAVTAGQSLALLVTLTILLLSISARIAVSASGGGTKR